MNFLLEQNLTNMVPAIVLVILFPLVLLLLSESIARSRRSGRAIARTLATLRNLVAPSLALFVFLRYIAEMPPDHTLVRLVESVFYISLLYALLGIINDLVFGSSIERPGAWQTRVPKLFRDLVRVLIVAIGAMIIYSQVWGREVSAALTALGLGSIVIGLALQEPLGNIVSGLMLLMERPINVGDFVNAEGVTGRIIEINWRSVHIETATRELHVIPNVSLYKGAFSNLSRPTPLRTEVIEMGFSYDDPPNRVKEIMLELLRTTPGVLADPPPMVRTFNYADFSIIYKMIFSVASQLDLAVTRDKIMTRLWYIARREGLTIPYPIAMEYAPDEQPGPVPPTPDQLLRDFPRFKPGLKTGDGQAPRAIDFASGEIVQRRGEAFAGFALILKGRAALHTANARNESIQVGELGPGECFGDAMSAGTAQGQLEISALSDIKVLVFDPRDIHDLLSKSPSLASELGDAIEIRRQAVQAIRARKTSAPAVTVAGNAQALDDA